MQASGAVSEGSIWLNQLRWGGLMLNMGGTMPWTEVPGRMEERRNAVQGCSSDIVPEWKQCDHLSYVPAAMLPFCNRLYPLTLWAPNLLKLPLNKVMATDSRLFMYFMVILSFLFQGQPEGDRPPWLCNESEGSCDSLLTPLWSAMSSDGYVLIPGPR